MTRWNYLLSIPCLILILTVGATAQTAGDYRSATSGNWETAAVWETYSGSAWATASTAPSATDGEITIQAGHSVTINASLDLDSVQVMGGGTLTIGSGATVTVLLNGGAKGIDVDTLGQVIVHGTILNQGICSGSVNAFTFEDGSVYDENRNDGSIPRSVWNTGSTFKLSGVINIMPSNTNQEFYNLLVDCPTLTSNLNMRMNGNTIHGDIRFLNTGPQRIYLTAPDSYVDPITILGNIYVEGGVFSSNGSGSAANITVHSYGNIFVTGGNFGCSRGSAPSVSWYLYGDTMSVHNATLQNSTGSPSVIQKFIFAKAGTQVLDFLNVGYGGSGVSSPITLQVNAGTTLDIGTSYLPNYSTGSFILDSGAVLVSHHNGAGSEGRIEYIADLGGGNSFVNIDSAQGTGTTTVKAFKGTHPNAYDNTKMLKRYWEVTADAGITQANMTFYYYDLDPVGSEVGGGQNQDAQYKALRYMGTGTDWATETASDVDNFFDFVTAPHVTTIGGVWSLGEAAPVGVFEDPSAGALPQEFFVSQNYPNPFNPSTTVTFGVPTEEYVSAAIYDLLGREVMHLFSGTRPPGTYQLQIDASTLTSGTYLCRVQAGSEVSIRRMILMK